MTTPLLVMVGAGLAGRVGGGGGGAGEVKLVAGECARNRRRFASCARMRSRRKALVPAWSVGVPAGVEGEAAAPCERTASGVLNELDVAGVAAAEPPYAAGDGSAAYAKCMCAVAPRDCACCG